MSNQLSTEYLTNDDAKIASDLARRCVQCGFCTATCPTFQITGNELDGPRGRISLIKGVLEGNKPSSITQFHLDRCLLCRNCETTCPSGVQYGKLYTIGKKLVEKKVVRRKSDQILRWFLKNFLLSKFFSFSVQSARIFRFILPSVLKSKIPKISSNSSKFKTINIKLTAKKNSRKVLLLTGCVQPALLPNINTSTIKLLNFCNIGCIITKNTTCCGALKAHLNDKEGSVLQAKQNIDSWWPYVKSGEIESIVVNASACSLEVKNYHELFPESSEYYQKAKKISSIAIDLTEMLPFLVDFLKTKSQYKQSSKLAFHPPCTLQHGQKINGIVEKFFNQLGFEVSIPKNNSNICCGSAGTYSVLNPLIANTLRDEKLYELNKLNTEIIISSNVGCIAHLQSGTEKKVMHWVEFLADNLEKEN